jgi:WD40 repeat protein
LTRRGARVVTAAGSGLEKVSSVDKTARVWDAARGQSIAVLKGHEDGVFSAQFSPDAKRVVTASYDKTARIWDISSIPKGDIFRVACTRLPDHDLTDIARDYGLTNLAPICEGDPPLPDPPPINPRGWNGQQDRSDAMSRRRGSSGAPSTRNLA